MANKELSHDSPEVKSLISKYHNAGLLTGFFGSEDEPGIVSSAHRHGAAHIFIIRGSAEIRLEGEQPRLVKPGDEITVNDQQEHSVRVGADGWEYLFACDAAEAEAQGIASDLS